MPAGSAAGPAPIALRTAGADAGPQWAQFPAAHRPAPGPRPAAKRIPRPPEQLPGSFYGFDICRAPAVRSAMGAGPAADPAGTALSRLCTQPL